MDQFKMAEFVRAQIFGTTFEITNRYAGNHHVARLVVIISWSEGRDANRPDS